MNRWVKESIEIANSSGYLDKLQEVYPVSQETEQTLSPPMREELKRIYQSGDDLKLVRRLLDFRKFPVKDPYVAFFRRKKSSLKENPATVKRIAERIRSLGFEGMIKALEEPKEFNRQIGGLFQKWLKRLGYPILAEEDFHGAKPIAFLQGTDVQLKAFADKQLGCSLEKGPDFIVKVRGKHILGEAKFLTDYGGHQNAQFEDAMRLLGGSQGSAIRVAVLDGVVWIKNSTKMHQRICSLEKAAFTALLFKEYLESLT